MILCLDFGFLFLLKCDVSFNFVIETIAISWFNFHNDSSCSKYGVGVTVVISRTGTLSTLCLVSIYFSVILISLDD